MHFIVTASVYSAILSLKLSSAFNIALLGIRKTELIYVAPVSSAKMMAPLLVVVLKVAHEAIYCA